MHRLMALHYITASAIANSDHIQIAIQRVKQAWETVKEETVLNCFRHCGMQATGTEPTEDPFADLDEDGATVQPPIAG